MEPGLRNWATLARRPRLISRFSATTSMIQSASAMRGRSSSKLPTETLEARAGVKKAAGLAFFAGAGSADTILFVLGGGGVLGKEFEWEGAGPRAAQSPTVRAP